MSQIPPFPEPVPPVHDPGLPYFKVGVYRDADGHLEMQLYGQQAQLDVNIAALPPGFSVAPIPEAVSWNVVMRYGFIDVDDPARPLCYDADKLKADGVTLAQILATTFEQPVNEPWLGRAPIKKPTKAR